jgi:RNA polymerase sigma-70 factor (ECF subfamily)
MSMDSVDSSIAIPLATAGNAMQGSPASALELEVISLFDQLREPLFRYVLSFGLSAHDAEDIIQEVFLSLFRHLRLGRCRRNLRGWLFRVAHNLSLRGRFANQKLWRQEGAENVVLDTRPDPAPSAEEQLVFNQRQKRLSAVFRVLPDQDQHCLRLRAEGLRYREIAEVLGISLGAVSLSLTRSLTRLGRADGR